MSKYDNMTVIDFLKEMTRRLDGIVTLWVIGIFASVAALSPIMDLRIGQLSGWTLSGALIGFAPIVFLYYTSLVYFSTPGRVSIVINSVLVGCIPLLFYYLA